MKSYRDLLVWSKSFLLVKEVYAITAKLPVNEKYGLTSQVQRSAISVPSNIAEGQQRNSKKEFVQFISIARGSNAELMTQLELIHDLYKINCTEALAGANEVGKMLYSLQKKIEKIS